MLCFREMTRCAAGVAALTLGLTLLATSPVVAGPDAGGKEQGAKNRPDREALRQLLLEKFDQDGDGKLNQEERAAASKAREERMAERGKGGTGKGAPGKGGAGRGKGAPGKPGNRLDFRRQLLEKFDADGDGKLNENERKAAREAFREQRSNGQRAGAGRPGRNGQQGAGGRKPGARQGQARPRPGQQGKRPGNRQRGPRNLGKSNN